MSIFPAASAVVQSAPDATADLHLQCRLGLRDSGRNLLELLISRFPYHGEDQWRQLIALGQVSINGQAGTPTLQVARGDLLEYRATGFTEPDVPTFFEPVLETADLLLVGKAAGTPVARTGLIVRNTLVNLLRRHYGEDIHPLHRLDRETGGLILCARSREACRRWQNCRPPLITGKYYLAVVEGRMPPGRHLTDQALATRPDSPVRCRMWPDDHGKPCRTIFHTIAAAAGASLVLAELITGRRHQIRAHLAHLGHPVIGDKIYSQEGRFFLKRVAGALSTDDFGELGATCHTLHAWALGLALPDCPESLYFSGLFPADLRRYLALFPGWESRAREMLAAIRAPSAPT